MSQEKYKIMTEKLEDRIRSLVVNFSRGFVDWACKNVQFEWMDESRHSKIHFFFIVDWKCNDSS